jgi:hypothetical protein
VTLCRCRGAQPGRVSLASDLYRCDPAVRKICLKVMLPLLSVAPPVDDTRLPDGTLKEVAHPPLVILQVLVTYQLNHAASVLQHTGRPNLICPCPDQAA